MGNVLTDFILSIVIFAVILFAFISIGMLLVKHKKMTKEVMQRTILSVVVFAIIYWSSDFVIGWREFNVYVKAIEFLAAVIGAGCYWIGSKK